MRVARKVLYLAKRLLKQPLPVSGSGGGGGVVPGPGGVGSPIGLLLVLTQAA
jgi:hypothetical protein